MAARRPSLLAFVRRAAGPVVVLLLGAAGAAVATSAGAAPSPATISVTLDAKGRGTFVARGALVDRGRAVARRSVVNGRLNATETLTGAKGRIVLTAQQRCVGRTGTWKVVAGTGAYARLAGRGDTAGRVSCAPLGPATVVHRGLVELPPPVLAEPGSWGGRAAQAFALAFTVTPDGRSVAGVRIGRYRYECVRSDGFRTTEPSPPESRFAGPFAIAEDRTFSLKTFNGTLQGRFGPAGATGTITIARTSPPNAQGQTTTCAGSIAWTATNPPGPPPRALSGTYCAITAAGGGVCLEVAPDGRDARSLRAEIKLTCGTVARIPLSMSTVYDRPMPFSELDLSFRQAYDQVFEGVTVRVSVSGTFDDSGGLVGSASVTPFNVERDGRAQLCRTSGAFTAKLQR